MLTILNNLNNPFEGFQFEVLSLQVYRSICNVYAAQNKIMTNAHLSVEISPYYIRVLYR
jgi:hypothetical protein